MRLPAANRAIVDEAKVRDYLLSLEHPVGRYKAAFFGQLGYSHGDWKRLREDIVSLARRADAEAVELTEYGQKYLTRGILTGPGGNSAEIVAVWLIRPDENLPRLVTAYPGGDA